MVRSSLRVVDTLPRNRRRRLATWLTGGSILWFSGIASGAPNYTITLQGGTQTSATALEGSFHTATPGVAPTVVDEDARAAPARVGARVRLQTYWPFEILAGFSGTATGMASTDDFVISGPPGSTTVTGSIHFRVKVDLDRSGGLAGSDRHVASVTVRVSAATSAAEGSGWFGNLDQGADGVLAGHTPPDLESSFSLAGTFPVGDPFAVSMQIEAHGETHGDSAASPGVASCDGWTAGLTLGDDNGHVMDLPAGYTVDAASWGVNANRVADVSGTRVRELAFRSAAPNPSAGSTRFGIELPRPGETSLVVTDLEGRRVWRLASSSMDEGVHAVVWDGRDESGGRVPPGVYFAVLRFGDRTIPRRVVRIR